jgi:hypothetical protein
MSGDRRRQLTTVWAAFVFGICLIGACGRTVIGPTLDHGEFETYFQRFEIAAKHYGRNIENSKDVRIEYGEVDTADVVGQCQTNILTGSRIVLVKSTWQGLSDASRESLIFHEFGHCILSRDHVPDDLKVGDPGAPETVGSNTPRSLMHPSFVPGSIYSALKDYYQKELFSR